MEAVETNCDCNEVMKHRGPPSCRVWTKLNGNGSLYNKLQQKLPESMLAQYHRWVFEKRKPESVKSLRELIIQEAEFQIIASETVQGSDNLKNSDFMCMRSYETELSSLTLKTQTESRRLCKVCNEPHCVWNCKMF